MATPLSPELIKGLQHARTWLKDIQSISQGLDAALEANKILVGYEKAEREHKAELEQHTAARDAVITETKNLERTLAEGKAKIDAELATYRAKVQQEHETLTAELVKAERRVTDAQARAVSVERASADRVKVANEQMTTATKQLAEAQRIRAEARKKLED